MGPKQSSRLRDQVMEFHAMIGQPIGVAPRVPSDERVRLRARLIAEEFFETLEAMFNVDEHDRLYTDVFRMLREQVMTLAGGAPVRVALPDLADGLADLDYVVEGTRIEFGINGTPVADEVHTANMRKAGGPKDANGKHLKPPGWTPPNIEKVLREQGWKGE